jgi:hypothetical protein
MFVRPGPGGTLHLITQPDHAALARRLMEHWEPLQDLERRDAILLAIGEHDNGWDELDASPSADPVTGRIFDFTTLPIAERQAVWPRGIHRLAERDRWAAALVALHALSVYSRYRGEANWTAFFAEVEVLCSSLTRTSGRTAAELRADYPFVRIGDLLSLTFCNQQTEPQAYEQWTIRLVADRVTITPDGWGGRELPFTVAARQVPDTAFRSAAEVAAAVERAPVILLSGVVSGSLAPA